MADINVERRRSGGGLTWVLALAAVVVVGGFLYWLGASSEPTSVAVVEGEAADSADAGPAATAVALGTFANAPDSYDGQTIRLESVDVASRLGNEAFWIQLPNQVPYLIKLDSAALSQAAAIQAGGKVTVTGPVRMMNDSVLGAWEQRGVLQGTQRDEASFATSFLEAVRVQPARGGQQSGAQQGARE